MEEPARDPVAEAAGRHPDRPALIAGDAVLTWAELDSRVSAAAHWTAARTAPGDRVALVLGNTVDFAVAYFGVLRAGRVAVPLNPGYTAREIDHAVMDSGAVLIVGEPAGPPRLRLVTAPRVPDGQEAGDGILPAVKAADLAVLLYTSGTSGRPKGAMLTHAALAANHDQLDRIEPPVVGSGDVVLLAVPFFHAYGLNTGLGTVAHHAATGVLAERFDPAETLALITRHDVTVAVGVPGMYQAWIAAPGAAESLRGLRTAVCGAAPLGAGTAARFHAATGKSILIGYGLTETAPVLTTTAVSHRDKSDSIGRPLPGIELLLRDPTGAELWRDGTPSVDDDLAELDRAELDLDVAASAGTDPGEIVVRGPNLFSGYWPDGSGGPGPDGWWPTGDVAYADGDGDLVLVDRIGELILVNGFNVYPAEIERVLDGHPRVAAAAVVAVPDAESGQRPHAYVVAAGDPPPSVAELQVWCAARLARFKLPGIELVTELPRSPIGKVRKKEL
ncbi:putative acyl-CoA synthetase [Actinoplanes missouriensis 431]|uniref:Putative acyl-CoA synthetase n=1 Tax=Actinoplanes missouriensis (strain ATCC 14538 / DSM 43046 / CBS 188.64 / JCM 3121 / NBRC 102363 / NCIMB 12654 / NRRL B-3342 / UNCC 431) TaxID=512565 RepID=I0HIG9_ACTM4|nr:AMP-binding protein [Actinoplanes missouriensis]BAL92806.1 putative acyl-CoA synthetase [Actinoplanes missouriensis 431]